MSAAAESPRLEAVADGVYRFDTRYIRPRHTAVYILVADGDAALVDCAVGASVGPLLEALDELGVARESVGHIAITHAHMDHMSGAGPLLEALPNARAYAHPSAAPHVIDPSKLEAGAREVFGDDFFEREYAPVRPVPAERVVETDDGASIRVGERVLQVVHTPGHAWHHQGFREAATATFFSGDAFGVGYRELTGPEGPFFVPETPPPQFKPDIMHQSIDRIVGLGPARVLPTHFETITDAAAVGEALHRVLDDTVERCWNAESVDALEAEVLDAYAAELERRGRTGERDALQQYYGFDARLGAQGLWVWREKQER